MLLQTACDTGSSHFSSHWKEMQSKAYPPFKYQESLVFNLNNNNNVQTDQTEPSKNNKKQHTLKQLHR